MSCVICAHHDPAPQWTVCVRCFERLDDDLARIVELTSHAANRLVREVTGSSGTRGVHQSRPPIDLAALDASLGNDVLPLLDSWERMIREDYGLSPLGPATRARSGALAAEQARSGVVGPPVTVVGSVGFLRAWLLRLAETPTFPIEEMAREIHDATRNLEQYDPHRTHQRHGVPVTCTADHPEADGRRCGYELRTNGTDTITCPRCLTRWTADDILDAHDMDLLPAAVLMLLDPNHSNPRERIANWAKRDRLTQHDTAPNPNGGHPIPLYRLGEYRNLLSTARATMRQPGLAESG